MDKPLVHIMIGLVVGDGEPVAKYIKVDGDLAPYQTRRRLHETVDRLLWRSGLIEEPDDWAKAEWWRS